jgi:hypothetical protein
MDLDLKEGWEKKALIIIAVIVIIIFAYAFNPFKSTGNVTSYNQSSEPQPTTTQVAQTPSTSNNSSNNGNNSVSTLINADQAKAIAESANKGYKASDPMQGNVVINGTTIAVWIVPMKSGMSSRTVYVDITTGRVVQQT